MIRVWYLVRDFAAARAFYTDKLGFAETFVDEEGSWAKLERGAMKIAIAEGDPTTEGGGVAAIDVDDVKAEAERLRGEDVVRVLDVFDPDGNRLQLVEELRVG